MDLVSTEVARKWQKKLNAVHPTVMYRSVKNTVNLNEIVEEAPVATPIGHGHLFHLIKTLLPDKQITVGVLGLPGVGKTTFISSLRSLDSHPTPSTKDFAAFKVDKSISFIDTVEVINSQPLPFILQGETPSR